MDTIVKWYDKHWYKQIRHAVQSVRVCVCVDKEQTIDQSMVAFVV